MLSTSVGNRLEELHPDIVPALQKIIRRAQDSPDAALLALCADYIEAALRNQLWQPPHPLSARERDFIAFTEQFVTSVGTMEDAQVTRLLQHATADEVYAFVDAIYVLDMTARLELVAGQVLT